MNIQKTLYVILPLFLNAVFLLLYVPPIQANTSSSEDTTTQASSKTITFRPAPLSESRSHLITEASFKFRVNSSPDDYIESHENNYYYWTADIGYVVNVSPVTGIGGTLFFGADHDGARLGIRARMRRWLRNGFTLDIAPGFLVNVLNHYAGSSPNFFFSAAFGHANGISGVIQMDRIAYSGHESGLLDGRVVSFSVTKKQTAWYFGISIDGNAGPTALVIGWVLVMLGGAASSR